MRTHVLINGEVLDLTDLTGQEEAFYDECLEAYRDNEGHHRFMERAFHNGNPMLRGGKMVTREIMLSPLYRAIRDLLARLSIRQGGTLPDAGDDLDTEPDAPDTYLSLTQAADTAGVTRAGLLGAVRDGRVVGRQNEDGYWMISERSLERYKPNRVRQTAGRQGGLR